MATTPSDGSVSRPENGGARNAQSVRPQNDHADDAHRRAVVEDPRRARVREPLDPADAPQEHAQEPLPRRAGELEALPARRQPDAPAPHDELQGDEHRHDLEDVRRAARGQRQGRKRHQQDEDHREAPRAEQRDEVAERLRVISLEPVLELVAHRHGGRWRRRREGHVVSLARLARGVGRV
jgi:hypothetical protein